jgi:uncharacterized protein (DUF1778 family)
MNKFRQIKVFVEPAAHDQVRLAAALKKTTMASFCRQVVLAEANRLTENIKVPEEPRRLGK